MEELIKKHLGINTPQWIINNCKGLLTEWDTQKADTGEGELTIPDVSISVCDHRYHSKNGRYILYEDWCEKCGTDISQTEC